MGACADRRLAELSPLSCAPPAPLCLPLPPSLPPCRLTNSVATSLEGQRLGSFTRVGTAVRNAVEEALTRILTPKRSIDVLREARAAKVGGGGGSVLWCVCWVCGRGRGGGAERQVPQWLSPCPPPTAANLSGRRPSAAPPASMNGSDPLRPPPPHTLLRLQAKGRPYVVVFVGVNGVGKSTNLAKVAYWLLQNDLTVMIAACDTFRSGAVEQLKTHCARLQVGQEWGGAGRWGLGGLRGGGTAQDPLRAAVGGAGRGWGWEVGPGWVEGWWSSPRPTAR